MTSSFGYDQKQTSLLEALARSFVTRFLSSFISTGCLTLHEGGSVLTYDGIGDKCALNVELQILDPQFYWKVMTRADIGLADAYIDGDFSFPDEHQGLLDFVRLLIANRDANKSLNKRRGWWTPMLFTAGVTSATLFYHHILRANTLTQARRNISRHYDLSNEVFALFLGETMQYSCGIFKSEEEDLNTAQMRKICTLIEKARINKDHKVLDIGCGWGVLAVEIVKRTGCRYVGITLSEEQLKFAETKVKAALQDHITLRLCDYRSLSKGEKFERIISCEMIEHVGHEYMEEFFCCCDSVLAEDGLFVIQFSSVVDERYEQYRRSTDFIKEYIFPGACVPSLSRVVSAMANGSTLSVEHVENIGSHYYRTLRLWRQKFLHNKSKIMGMGFDEKFIRTWEYYFDYCAAGFKSYTLANYQVVFSRPGNVKALGDPYKAFPSQFDVSETGADHLF